MNKWTSRYQLTKSLHPVAYLYSVAANTAGLCQWQSKSADRKVSTNMQKYCIRSAQYKLLLLGFLREIQ